MSGYRGGRVRSGGRAYLGSCHTPRSPPLHVLVQTPPSAARRTNRLRSGTCTQETHVHFLLLVQPTSPMMSQRLTARNPGLGRSVCRCDCNGSPVTRAGPPGSLGGPLGWFCCRPPNPAESGSSAGLENWGVWETQRVEEPAEGTLDQNQAQLTTFVVLDQHPPWRETPGWWGGGSSASARSVWGRSEEGGSPAPPTLPSPQGPSAVS